MAQVRFKVNVSDKLDYTPLDTIEDNISVVRGNFTTGQHSLYRCIRLLYLRVLIDCDL